jgi:hypothetical protein
MNTNKIFKEISRYGSVIVGAVTLDGYRRGLVSDSITNKINEFREQMETCERKSVELKDRTTDFLNNIEESNAKIVKVSSEISNSIESIKHQAELLKTKMGIINNPEISSDVKLTMTKEVDSINDSLLIKSKIHSEVVSKASNTLDELTKNNGSTSTSSNVLEDLWINFNDFISNASTAELGAIGHISMSIAILFCLGSLVSVFYGDTLIIKFKLEERFPRLAKFIQLRRKFQQYYFLYNVIFIVLILLYVIYINLCVLIYSI